LVTLEEKLPTQHLRGVTVYHLPHLIHDLILPQLVDGREISQLSSKEARFQRPPAVGNGKKFSRA